MSISANKIIEKLNLQPLTVEGGFFYETYRSDVMLPDGKHSCGTCIYYLLKSNDCSNWHKVSTDEIWLYHTGIPAIQLLLFPDGSWTERMIGPDIIDGQVPQSLIPAGTWQAAVLVSRKPADWGLFGAAVFPSFEYADFTVSNGMELSKLYPEAVGRMKKLGLG
jgi:predicted cupin superfamily sugar epimerase